MERQMERTNIQHRHITPNRIHPIHYFYITTRTRLNIKEKPIHHDAFEYFFFILSTKNLNPGKKLKKIEKNDVFEMVAERFDVTSRTVRNWYACFGWSGRVDERGRGIRLELERELDDDIVRAKVGYLRLVEYGLGEYRDSLGKGVNPAGVKNTRDLERLIKLGLLLHDQATEITQNTILDREERLNRLKRIGKFKGCELINDG